MNSLLVPQSYGPFHYFTTRLNLALAIAAWLAFILRIWVRQKYLKHCSADDYLMLAALVLFTAYAALAIVFMYILASGRIVLELQKFSDTYAATVGASFWTNITLKLSLCCFFLRLLNQRWTRYTIIAATILSTVANIAGSLVFLITCGGPRQAVSFLFMGQCKTNPLMDPKAFVRAGIWFPTYTNMAVDIVFSLIPIPMLMQTTLDRKQKITVGFYLALSCIGSVCAIGKIFFSYRKATEISSYVGIARNFAAFNTGELAAYIIGGCIAAYRPLFMSLGRRLGSTIASQARTSRTEGGTLTSSTALNTTTSTAARQSRNHHRQSAGIAALAGIKNSRRSMFISPVSAQQYDGDKDFPSPMSTVSQTRGGSIVKGHSAKSSRDEGGVVRFDEENGAYDDETLPSLPEIPRLPAIQDEEKQMWPPHPAVRPPSG